MISNFFHAAFYNPIYNALIALTAVIPTGDAGLAVVILTIGIRLILLPFSLAAARTQRAMRELEPKIKALKEQYKGNREKEATETLALYREARVNPFASILMALIQIPILLALFWVFQHESFSAIHTALLYSFTPIPDGVSLVFLGLMPLAGKSIVLALIAAVTQYFQAHVALSGTMKISGEGMQADFQRVLGLQLRYVFPFLIGAISYTAGGAVALYFVTTNIVGILQEFYVRRHLARTATA